MSQNNYFVIKSIVELKFTNSDTRNIAYNTFLPEFHKLSTPRSIITMEKQNNSLVFQVESKDITAFRASINEIISLGKIIDNTLRLCE